MRIRDLHLERFRQHQDAWFSFVDGLNVIVGPNESGKSALQTALLFALFGNPRHTTLNRTLKVDDYVAWGSDQRFAIELDFDASGVSYHLEKDWQSKTAKLSGSDGACLTDEDAVQERLAELLGCSLAGLYMHTACVRQDDLASLDDGSEAISGALLQRLSSSHEQSLERVTDELDKAVRAQKNKGKKNPGTIERIDRTLADMRDEMARIGEAASKVHDARRSLSNSQQKKAELESELDDIQRISDAISRVERWENQLKEASDEEDQLEQRLQSINSANQDLGDANARLKELGEAGVSLQTDDRLQALKDDLADGQIAEQLAMTLSEIDGTQRELDAAIEAEQTIAASGFAPGREAEFNESEARVRIAEKHLSEADRAWRTFAVEAEAQQKELFLERERLNKESMSLTRWSPLVTGLTALAVLLIVAGILFVSSQLVLGVAGIICGVLLAVYTLLLQPQRMRKTRQAAQSEACSDIEQALQKIEISQRVKEKALQEATREAQVARQAVADLLQETGVDSLEDYYRLADQLREAQQHRRLVENELLTRLQGRSRDDLVQERDECSERASSARQEMHEILTGANVAAPDDYRELVDELRQMDKSRLVAEKQLETLLQGSTQEALEKERSRVSRERRDAQEALAADDIKAAGEMTALERQTLVEKAKDFAEQLSELEAAIIRDETVIANAGDADVHLLDLQSRCASLQDQQQRARDWLQVCETALQVMNEAGQTAAETVQTRLEPVISASLNQLTSHYTRARVDSDLSVSVYDETVDRWLLPERGVLSEGTVDQVYLVSRLAMVQALFDDDSPPVLLDDPFVTFDQERRHRALELCRHLANDYQILLFTCQPDISSEGDHVVPLSVTER